MVYLLLVEKFDEFLGEGFGWRQRTSREVDMEFRGGVDWEIRVCSCLQGPSSVKDFELHLLPFVICLPPSYTMTTLRLLC